MTKARAKERIVGAVPLTMAVGLAAKTPAPLVYKLDRPVAVWA